MTLPATRTASPCGTSASSRAASTRRRTSSARQRAIGWRPGVTPPPPAPRAPAPHPEPAGPTGPRAPGPPPAGAPPEPRARLLRRPIRAGVNHRAEPVRAGDVDREEAETVALGVLDDRRGMVEPHR